MTEANLVRRGIALPTVGNPAAANHILKGYEVVTADGELLVGTLEGTKEVRILATYPTVKVTEFRMLSSGNGTATGFSDNTSSFVNSYGFVPRASGQTLTTYFSQITGFSQGTSARLGPHGQIQINPYSGSCSVSHVPVSDGDNWTFTVLSARFAGSFLTATVVGLYPNFMEVTMSFSLSYSLREIISLSASL